MQNRKTKKGRHATHSKTPKNIANKADSDSNAKAPPLQRSTSALILNSLKTAAPPLAQLTQQVVGDTAKEILKESFNNCVTECLALACGVPSTAISDAAQLPSDGSEVTPGDFFVAIAVKAVNKLRPYLISQIFDQALGLKNLLFNKPNLQSVTTENAVVAEANTSSFRQP